MPNPNLPNLGTSLASTGFSKPEPSFFDSGGGFGGLTSGIRNVTRNLAAGFAKDPLYRQQAAQQLAMEEQAQQEQIARIRQAVVEASLDNLGQLSESFKGVGSEALMSSPSTLQMIERAANNAGRALAEAGWPENEIASMVEQYKWRMMASADQPAEMTEAQRNAAAAAKLGATPEQQMDVLGVTPTKPEEDKGEERTLMLGDGQTFNYKVFKDGRTNIKAPDGRTLMESDLSGGQASRPSGGDYRAQLAQDESSGGTETTNPLNPNVKGKYQISEPHWPQTKGLDDESKLTVVLNSNAETFKATFGKDPNDFEQYAMHRLGADGFQNLMSAPAGADVVDVVGDVVVEDNPDLAGKTVADVLSDWKSRYGTGMTWQGQAGGADVVSELRKPEKKEPIETKQIYDPNSPTGIRIVTEEEAIGQPGVPPAQAAAMENKADKEWEDKQVAIRVFEAQAERIKKKLAKGTAVGGVSSLVQTIAGIGAQVEMLGEALGVDASIADPEQYIGEMPPEAADMSAALQSDIVGLAYSMALAQNGNRVTNEDVKRALQQIGDSGMLSDPSQIAAALDSSVESMYVGLEAEAEARGRELKIKRRNATKEEDSASEWPENFVPLQ